jgi:hypothetical protein
MKERQSGLLELVRVAYNKLDPLVKLRVLGRPDGTQGDQYWPTVVAVVLLETKRVTDREDLESICACVCRHCRTRVALAY